MTIRARTDLDVIFHDSSDTTMVIGALSEHTMGTATTAISVAGTVATSVVSIVGSGPLTTLAVKNTGNSVLRLGGSIDVPAGRLAVIPTTVTLTVSAPSGSGSYAALWVG
jgi:hypothetical protein